MSIPLKHALYFALGLLTCWLYFLVAGKVGVPVASLPQSQGVGALKSAPSSSDFLHTGPAQSTRQEGAVQTPSPGLSKAAEEERLKDVKRSVEEDVRLLTGTLSLTLEQQSRISKGLQSYRLSTEVPPDTEYEIIRSALNKQQTEDYEKYVEQRRRSDAELLVTTRIHSVEQTTGPLTEEQKDTIFQRMTSSLITGEVISDAEILRNILSEKQFKLWSQSADSAPIPLPRQ